MTDGSTPQEEMRAELKRKFEDAGFPVSNQIDLARALDGGPNTTFSAGGIEVTAMELATRGRTHLDFPYETLDAFLDDAIHAMDTEGYFE